MTSEEGNAAPETAVQLNSDNVEQRVFTQEQLDAIVRDRLERERRKYADYEALKEQAAKWASHEESQKSELQKLQEKAAEWQRKHDELAAQYQRQLKRNAISMTASRLNIDPKLADKLVDYDALALEGDEVRGAEDVLKALLKEFPYIQRVAGGNEAPSLDADKGGGGRKQAAKLSDAEVHELAVKFRLSDEAMRESLRKQGRL